MRTAVIHSSHSHAMLAARARARSEGRFVCKPEARRVASEAFENSEPEGTPFGLLARVSQPTSPKASVALSH